MYLLEGHTALRIIYPDGRDIAVNWGTFDFADPAFPLKFAKGETDYWVSAEPTDYFLMAYGSTGRGVTEQQLNLSSDQATCLASLIEENLRPENRVYRYRYLTDNCATRPMALIEHAIAQCGDSLKFNTPEADVTWRSELRGYHRNHPLYQLFIDVALGAGIDSAISPVQQAFAPIFLSALAADATIVSLDGTSVPLVSSTRVVIAPRYGVAGSEPSPGWFVIPVCMLTGLVAFLEVRRRRLVRWYNALLFLLLSVPAAVVTFLVFFSSQEATGHNINLLWLNPLCLCVPLLVWARVTRRVLTPLMWLNLLLTAVYLFGIPLFRQSTGVWLPLLALCDLSLTAAYLFVCARHVNSRFPLARTKLHNEPPAKTA